MRRLLRILSPVLVVLAACGAGPVERDVTLRITRNDEVVHASGFITHDDTAVLVARFSLAQGKTATLVIQGGPATRVVSYEEWRGEQRLFRGVIADQSVVGDLDNARVGDRVAFHCVADDGGQRIVLAGAATITAVRGAPPPVERTGEYDEWDEYDDDEDVVLGCDGTDEPYPEPEPEPEPEEEWASSGGCGGIEGDPVEDEPVDEEPDGDDDEAWDDEETWDDDASASGCEGDTYEVTAARSKRTRRAVRGAWVMLWPIGLVAFVNRRARRRLR